MSLEKLCAVCWRNNGGSVLAATTGAEGVLGELRALPLRWLEVCINAQPRRAKSKAFATWACLIPRISACTRADHACIPPHTRPRASASPHLFALLPRPSLPRPLLPYFPMLPPPPSYPYPLPHSVSSTSMRHCAARRPSLRAANRPRCPTPSSPCCARPTRSRPRLQSPSPRPPAHSLTGATRVPHPTIRPCCPNRRHHPPHRHLLLQRRRAEWRARARAAEVVCRRTKMAVLAVSRAPAGVAVKVAQARPQGLQWRRRAASKRSWRRGVQWTTARMQTATKATVRCGERAVGHGVFRRAVTHVAERASARTRDVGA